MNSLRPAPDHFQAWYQRLMQTGNSELLLASGITLTGLIRYPCYEITIILLDSRQPENFAKRLLLRRAQAADKLENCHLLLLNHQLCLWTQTDEPSIEDSMLKLIDWAQEVLLVTDQPN